MNLENVETSALDVAAFIVKTYKGYKEANDLTPMKLHKLLYYAQGYFLALFNEPIFTDAIEAWEHGPVVPSVYDKYQSEGIIGADIIVKVVGNPDKLTNRVKKFLNEVIEVKGQFSAEALRNMSHKERPWKETYRRGQRRVIGLPLMRDYFLNWIVREDA